MRILYLTLVICLAAAAVASAQSPTPFPKPVEKANARPEPLAPAEPFDKASVATMASKCVTLDTESGLIEMEFFPERAPESVRNFLNLVSIDAYDGTTFNRVVPGFVIQGGSIWTRNVSVTAELATRSKRPVPDEPNKILHERGIVSMARRDEPNTATTNFFILVDKADYLDGKFAAFGRVTKGMEVVDFINKAPVSDEKPNRPVRIRKATVTSCASVSN